jgi:ketosteroid isomerase-like protein
MATQAVIQPVYDIFRGVDARDWPLVESAFAPEALLDYTSMAGGEPARLSPAAITAAWKGLLPGFYSTHHQLGDFSVEESNGTAQASAHGLALHYLPFGRADGEDVWVVVGTYDFELQPRGDGQWAVSAMKFNMLKQAGNLALPVLAQQNAQTQRAFAAPAVSESARRVVEGFFTALEAMDIERFMAVWADEPRQIMPLSPPGFPTQLDGRDAIRRQYGDLPSKFSSMRFPRALFATDDPSVVIAQYRGEIKLKGGGEYNNVYAGLFEIENGRLRRFTEYFDPSLLEAGFGPGVKG